MASDNVFAIVLAGGEGKRLAPLTADRAKPAVPFGGNYRLIDFALSNLVNAGFLQIAVLTQYKSHSLDRHIATTWRLSPLLGNYVTPVPAQMRRGPHWFSGSADAIYQNLNLIHDERPDHVVVFGADHIYRMDPRQMLDQHIETGRGGDGRGAARADLAGRPVRRRRDGRGRAHDQRLPREAQGRRRPGGRARPGLRLDGQLHLHDRRAREGGARGRRRRRPPSTTWAATSSRCSSSTAPRTCTTSRATPCRGRPSATAATGATSGTLDAFYDAHMDLISVHPVFNLYNREWPILTWPDPLPPAKFVFEEEGRMGHALDSMVCAGVVISGATVRRSVLSPGVHAALLRRDRGLDPVPGRRRRPLGGRARGRSSTRT